MKHTHFIGICGVAMGGIAVAFKKAGWKVTGSDAGFFPPVSDYLKKNNIDFYPGWHPEKIGTPDLIVISNVASSTNPEWQYVRENKLNYKSYPEVIAEYFVKPNSIVCAGTYGKTTTAALLSWVLTKAGYNPSYMFGGLTVDEFDSTKMSDSKYSVLEGDEYKSSKWDAGPKFSHYSPTHLLLTAVEWDHADVYPTEESYIDAFQKLVGSIPKNGTLIMHEKISNFKFQISNIITYGQSDKCNYKYLDVKTTKNGITLNIIHNSTFYILHSTFFGDYMAENITGVFAMAHQIGIEPEKIIKAIAEFKGLKRRLEKRCDGKIAVFDDIAHSPIKASFVLKTLAEIYKNCPPLTKGRCPEGTERSKIIAVFEPNTGNRQRGVISHYDRAFDSADEVIIPRLTKIKTDPNKETPLEGDELAQIILKTHHNVKYIPDDEELINYLTKNTANGDMVTFLGSHGFRGMIDELINRFKK